MNFNEIRTAISECVRQRRPFAAYALPDVSDFVFVAGNSSISGHEGIDLNSFEGFAVSFYGKNSPFMSVTAGYHQDNYNSIIPYNCSTRYESYVSGLEKLISSFGSEKEKTVVSRIVAVDSACDPVYAAERYFDCHKDCFRHIYYIPRTGLWFGATPELLFEYDRNEGIVRTMALAGTRQCDGSADWDMKNTHEHNLVITHIKNVLNECGLNVEVGKAHNLKFDKVEHLCHDITAVGSVDLNELYEKLNPTPAVCGYPYEQAVRHIESTESHNRYCYAGVVAVGMPGRLWLFVNLRCAFVSCIREGSYRYNLYAGGGINSMSDPECEWEEATHKMQSLLVALGEV